MKTLFFVTVLLGSAGAFGQSAGVLSNQSVPLQMSGNPQHASLTALACERPLVGGAPDTYSFAEGERPLWEFGPVSQPVSLGEVARNNRKEKATAKQAERGFEKQGS